MSTGKNAYYCSDCEHYIVTVHVDEGVTPMFLACRVLGEPDDPANTCRGRMQSCMYAPEPWPNHVPTEPAWEWFKPTSLRGYSAGMRDHIERGGLALRRKDA